MDAFKLTSWIRCVDFNKVHSKYQIKCSRCVIHSSKHFQYLNLLILLPESYEKVTLFLSLCWIRNLSISHLPKVIWVTVDGRASAIRWCLQMVRFCDCALTYKPSDQTPRCPSPQYCSENLLTKHHEVYLLSLLRHSYPSPKCYC